MDLARYSIGPLPPFTCLTIIWMKNFIVLKIFLFYDLMSIVRYLLIFYIKNLFGFDNRFWSTYINMWVISFCALSQFVFVFMPGRQPINFYICSGLEPESDKSIPKKFNLILNVIPFLSLAIHVGTHLRIYLYKKTFQNEIEGTKEEDQNYATFSIKMFLVVIFIINAILNQHLNDFDPEAMNFYPGNVFVYFMHLFWPLILASAVLLYFITNIQMRVTVARKIKELIQKFGLPF